MLEECASYLEACIYNIKDKKIKKSSEALGKTHISERLKSQKYQCKAHIQLCAILSQLGQHELALSHGKQAVKKCEHFFSNCFTLCSDQLARHRQKPLKPGAKKSSENPQYMKFYDLVMKALPNLDFIINKLKNKKTKTSKALKLDMRSVLGVQKNNDWIYGYNIGDMMLLQPLSVYDMQNNMGVQAELTRDLMLEKILMAVVGHFCIATEIRFLSVGSTKVQASEGMAWHKKALELAQPFLPSACPLLLHITNSFMRNYSEELEVKTQGKMMKKAKNKTPNPEMKRPRSTSAPKTKNKDERPSTASTRTKKKPSPRIGDRTPPARTIVKNMQFNLNSPTINKIASQKPKTNPFYSKPEDPKPQTPKDRLAEPENSHNIVISSYDLYGIHSEDESQNSEDTLIDSTGGKLIQEPVLISATGGNSCLFKA